MTDQQRWDTLGCYGNGIIRTPHLDALAARGIRFEHAYVPTPLCTPSRASILTGLYSRTHGMRSNETAPLPPDLPTLPELLRLAGYVTLLAGKDHVFDAGTNSADTAGASSTGRRRDPFDRAVRFKSLGREPGPADSEADIAMRSFRKGLMRRKWVDVEPYPVDWSTTARITAAATEMIDSVDPDQPFFLWLSYPDPHPPFVVVEPYASMYRDAPIPPPITRPGELDSKPLRQRLTQRLMEMDAYTDEDIRRIREIYYGMVSLVDDQVGRFLDHLAQGGRADDTIIVFTSDHGDYLGDHGMVRKGPALYDCLTRVPLIVSWPTGLSGGREEREQMVESVDLLPTLLEWVGADRPPRAQGRSLVPYLSGLASSHRDRVHGCYGVEGDAYTADQIERLDVDELLVRRPYRWGNWVSPVVMRGRFWSVRTHDWKLVWHANREGELYDLRHDPSELENLYGRSQHSKVERQLMEDLLRWAMATDRTDPPYEADEPPFRDPHEVPTSIHPLPQ